MDSMYMLRPEVAGQFGDKSQLEYQNGKLSNVKFVHYEFDGWLGDELLKLTRCFIVTKSLAEDINQNILNTSSFENVLVTKSDEFNELYPNRKLPEFLRLMPAGTVEMENNKITSWSGHDICLKKGLILVVTKHALNVLKTHKIDHCEIEELEFQ